MTTPDSAGGSTKAGSAAMLASIVRTFVPVLIGLVVAFFTKLGVPMDDQSAGLLVNGVVSAAIAAGYYLISRILEVTVNSKFGWLLGFAAAPIYKPTP